MSAPAHTGRRIVLPAADSIPSELRQRDQWVCWKYKADGQKLPMKPWAVEDPDPVQHCASTSDPTTWGTFEQALAYARQRRWGVGFVLTANNPYCGIDFDDVRDPATGKIAIQVFERILSLGSYTEVSPSGKGVKTILKGHLSGSGLTDGKLEVGTLEVYDTGRFFTITGEHLAGTPDTIEERQAELEALVAEGFGSSDGRNHPGDRVDTAQVLAGVPERQRDSELFRLACKLRHADVPQDMAKKLVIEAAANCDPPFPEREARAKVASVYGRYSPGGGDMTQKAGAASWPAPLKPEALYGLAGDIVRLVEPHTEADPAAILTNILVMTGNAVGYMPHFVAEQTKHGLRLFAVQVGDTAKGRKGAAEAIARAVFNEAASEWLAHNLTTGLSTGEGLIWGVRDAISKVEPIRDKGRATGETQDVLIDRGITDKRLLVIEPEFARTLRVMARDGNSLSAVVRQAWDSGNLSVLTKNTPAKATGGHISIVGHITKDELLHYLDSIEAFNGFANRFLWVAVKRSKCLPEGGDLPYHELKRLGKLLGERIRGGQRAGLITRDPDARAIWHDVYPKLSEGKPGLVGAVLGRAEAQVMRLACIYALLDNSNIIRAAHLTAALAYWERCEASGKYIFGDKVGDPVADTIFARLCQGEATQTELSTLFGRNYPASRLSQALEVLVKTGLATSFQKETGGRPQIVWRVS